MENLNKELEAIDNTYIGTIDENASVEIMIIRASRKQLRRLKEMAAYNVGQHLNKDVLVDCLPIPNSLKKLGRQFVIMLSGDYMFDLNENLNKVD